MLFFQTNAFKSPQQRCQSAEWISKHWHQPGIMAHWPHRILVHHRTLDQTGVAAST